MPSRNPRYQVVTDQTGFMFPTKEEAIAFAADRSKALTPAYEGRSIGIPVYSLRSQTAVCVVRWHPTQSGEFMGEPWEAPEAVTVHRFDRYGRELQGDYWPPVNS